MIKSKNWDSKSMLDFSFFSREHWLWDTASKRNGISLFSIVLRTLQLLLTLEPLIYFRWGFQQNVPLNEHINQIENWKCHMFNFRLIFLDHITHEITLKHTNSGRSDRGSRLCNIFLKSFVPLNLGSILLFQSSGVVFTTCFQSILTFWKFFSGFCSFLPASKTELLK